MSKTLKITLIQTDIFWEKTTANLANYEEKIAKHYQPTDLILLPEMFNSGFSMNVSEPMNFTTHKWLKQMAMQYDCHIGGSVAISEDSKKFNRFLIQSPDGATVKYDKKHLFGFGHENKSFSAGNKRTMFKINEWTIMPLVCYDLRFPVWSRNVKAEVDVILYVASWPQTRIEAWKSLLKARAIENQCYVIGLNRVGVDGNNLAYNGQSMVFDFEGNVIADLGDHENILSVELDFESLMSFRSTFPFLKDADECRLLE